MATPEAVTEGDKRRRLKGQCRRRRPAVPDPSKHRVWPLLPPRETLDALEWPLERFALCVLWILLLFCPFWWWIDWRQARRPNSQEARWDERRANWVLGWVVVLLVLWLVNPAPTTLKVFFAVLAGVRLLEVFTTGLGTALREQQQVRARNLVTIAFYFVQVTLIFAILYHCLATSDFIDSNHSAASRVVDYLYISWSNITSLGNSIYVPEGDTARFLEVLTTTSGILLLGVLLAFGIGEVSGKDEEAAKKPDEPGGQASLTSGRRPYRLVRVFWRRSG